MRIERATRIIICLVASLMCTFISSMANTTDATNVSIQQKKNDIIGKIVDAKGEPMSYANVVLLSLPDSTFIQGCTSDAEGKFSIVCQETVGVIKVTCVGYETEYVNLKNFKGTIQLREDSKMLKDVTVKAQRPKTKLTGNSMITSIEGTVLEKSGTAQEMLGKVPGMTKKGEDLEVLGKGTPVFYINGRKMTDKDELKRLRSEEINEVEVITNPGALYDATVTSVVRIKTKKRQGDGFGYDLMANNDQDLESGYADPNATINLRYRHNSLDLFGMVNYWKWDSVNKSTPRQSSWMRQDGNLVNILQDTEFRNDWHGQGFNYNVGFNYQLNTNHSFGMRVEKHDKFNSGVDAVIGTEMIHRYIDVGADDVVEEDATRQDDEQHQPYSLDGNAYYNGKFGKLGIDWNVDFVTTKTNEKNYISNWTTRNRTGEPTSYMNQSQQTKSDMWATKLVFSYPIWKGQIQTGTEMSFVNRANKYNITGYPLPTTDSEVKEDNIAGFVEYSCAIPKVGNFSAGVRYEHVGFDYRDALNGDKDMSRYTDDFFPSISWSQQFGKWQTALSFTCKTIRPNYNMLDESVLYINSYSLQQGDPTLKNAVMKEISANVRYNWLNLFLAYEQRDNTLSQWSYIYNNEGVILIKNINLKDPVRNLAMFVSGSPTFGCYTPNWTIGGQKFFVKQNLLDPREATGQRVVRYTKPIFYLDLNNCFRLKHSWQLEANMNYLSKGDVMNFHLVSPRLNVGFVVQKCFLKNDALCLRATLSDVFKQAQQNIDLDCGYYTLRQKTMNNNHRLNVSVRYTFNASQSKYKGTGAGKDAQKRMSND